LEDPERFEIDYEEYKKMLSLNDHQEQVIIVMSLEQVEKILEWYCEKFGKIVI
jgi:hypothetical protein